MGDKQHVTTVPTPPAESHPRELSMADKERKSWNKGAWITFIVALLAAIVVPYGAGRLLAMNNTEWIVRHIGVIEPRGVALLSWVVTVVVFTSLAMAVMETHRVFWRVIFIVSLAVEQLIAGVALLRLNFWYSTYVVYGNASEPINAANLGIIAAGMGVAVFAVIYVGLLVLIRKDSPLNILTRSWSALTLFFVIEIIALAIVLFGGLLTAV